MSALSGPFPSNHLSSDRLRRPRADGGARLNNMGEFPGLQALWTLGSSTKCVIRGDSPELTRSLSSSRPRVRPTAWHRVDLQ